MPRLIFVHGNEEITTHEKTEFFAVEMKGPRNSRLINGLIEHRAAKLLYPIFWVDNSTDISEGHVRSAYEVSALTLVEYIERLLECVDHQVNIYEARLVERPEDRDYIRKLDGLKVHQEWLKTELKRSTRERKASIRVKKALGTDGDVTDGAVEEVDGIDDEVADVDADVVPEDFVLRQPPPVLVVAPPLVPQPVY